MIATKTEIKTLAFNANFDINSVKDNVIQIVEWEQVMSFLGTELYDDLVSTPASYTELLTFIKPLIAHAVRAQIIMGVHVKTGNKGAQTANGSNETIADPNQVKREAMQLVESYRKQAIKWLNENKPALWKGEVEYPNIINKIIVM